MNHRLLRATTVAFALSAITSLTSAQTALPTTAQVARSAGAALAACTDAPPAREARSAEWWTSASRLLAGLEVEPGRALADVVARPSVGEHLKEFGAEWSAFEGKRLRPISQFGSRELWTLDATAGPIFYPFSGPDTAYALAFFPAASDLILTGLEPVGELPDFAQLDEATLDASLDQLRSSLRSILALSFFVTREMDSDLRRTRLSGVTPIMMLFLARHGYSINAVEPLVLDADGRLCQTSAAAVKEIKSKDARIPGVLVRFQRPGEARERRIYYFKTDLSDAGLTKRPQYLKFVEAVRPQATLAKSASYLMHFKEFSMVRDYILANSKIVLQDDTGVPIKHYKEASWERRLYGQYVGPIPIFKQRYQRDMNDAYRQTSLPLGFGIGYRYESHQSNLQLYVRRPTQIMASDTHSK